MSSFDHKFKQDEKEKLQALISKELCRISPNYTQDGVLPEYVLVMLQNKKTKSQIANDLEAFLGKESKVFADWLWGAIESFLSGEQDIKMGDYNNNKYRSRDSQETRRPASVIVVSEAVKSEEKNISNMVPNSRLILSAVREANDSIKSKTTLNNSEKMKLEDKQPRQEEKPSTIRTKRTYKVRNVGYKKEDRKIELDEKEDEEEEVTFTVTMNDIKSHKRERTVIDNKENDTEISNNSMKKIKKIKCEYWPLCKRGDDCLYWHPKELCKNLPKCLFGDKCLYIHPNTSVSIPCKYGFQCASKECIFLHPPGYRYVLSSQNTPSASIPCKHGFACHKDPCVYSHPLVKCKFSLSCVNGTSCAYSHAPECKYGNECTRVDCSFAHPFVKSVPCKFGSNCNKLSCKFTHNEPID